MQNIIDEIKKVVKGKEDKVKIILAAFFAGEHVLIEDVPGVGKTTIAKTISSVLGLEFKRIQFTADMLPSDIIGVNYFDLNAREFIFKRGPIFSEIILADEINRASPKAQSALLEAMEEKQVSVDGKTYKLSEDFFVIATQNPVEHGIYPLPLSQIDRFGISLSIGYPKKEFEKMILLRKEIQPQSVEIDIAKIKKDINGVYTDEKIIEMILNIGEISRKIFDVGLSTRALISMLHILKSWVYMHNKKYAIDQDVLDILPFCVNHRLKDDNAAEKIIQALY